MKERERERVSTLGVQQNAKRVVHSSGQRVSCLLHSQHMREKISYETAEYPHSSPATLAAQSNLVRGIQSRENRGAACVVDC